MKANTPNRSQAALTFWEVLIVLGLLVCAAALFYGSQYYRNMHLARRIQCHSHLAQFGIAFRGWAMDHGEAFPMYVPVTNGGTMGLPSAYQHFQVLSNELNNPALLTCPADPARTPATSFTNGLSDKNISYFLNLDVGTNNVNAFLVGDRNLTVDGTAAKTGMMTVSPSNALGWTAGFHRGSGNVLMADGSVQTFSPTRLNEGNQNSDVLTNRLLFP